MKRTIIVISSAFLLFACNDTSSPKEASNKAENETQNDYSLIGKKAVLTFPEMRAEVQYLSESKLHWKTTDAKGVTAEGDEQCYYKALTGNLHFLNWIEKDGFTVSQIIDTKNGTVKAYWSFADEKSDRGQRSSSFIDAKFEFVK